MRATWRQLLACLLLVGSMAAQDPAKRVILILGPPGSGKTTQSERLKAALGLPVVSMADAFKREIAGDNKVSDGMANTQVRRRITQKDCERGFILDGYPATANQAEYFEALLADLKLPRPVVIHLSVPDSEADRRLEKRGHAEDSAGNRERRIVEYRTQAELLLPRYPDAITLDGTRSPDLVATQIRRALKY